MTVGRLAMMWRMNGVNTNPKHWQLVASSQKKEASRAPTAPMHSPRYHPMDADMYPVPEHKLGHSTRESRVGAVFPPRSTPHLQKAVITLLLLPP
jgi:hypothetical protein